MKLEYNSEFKTKVFNTLRFTPVITDVMKAMEDNSHTVVRYCLEDALDDPDLYVKDQVTDDGDRVVANAKINAYTDRRMLYSEFMEMFVQEMDAILNPPKMAHVTAGGNNG